MGEGRTGRALFARLEEAPWLRPGDFVRVTVVEPPLEGVARLPASALGADGAVLVLGDEARLEVAPVTLMRRQGDDVLVRAPGLAGREVVAERSPLLGPGIKVRPVRPEDEPGEPPQDDARAAAASGAIPAVADAPGTGPAVAVASEATVVLAEGRRAALRAAVEADAGLPRAERARLLAELDRAEVPLSTVERIEAGTGI